MVLKQGKKNILMMNCSSGISGDMMAAALLDLGADQDNLLRTLASLPLEGYKIAVSRVKKSGIDACDFDVILDAEHENHDHDMAYLHPDRFTAKLSRRLPDEHTHTQEEDHDHDHHDHDHHDHDHHDHDHHDHDHHDHDHHDHDHYDHDHHDHDHHDHDHHDHDHHDHAHHDHDHAHHDHDHHHHHHGRNLDDIFRILEAGSLSPSALELAKKIFRILADAESKAHGLPLDQVHFHEVGAVDSIVDIASAAICIDQLGITDCIFTDLTEGSGTVRCQHGILPIPVPATANILADHHIPFHISSQIMGELITPTGAALVAALRTDTALPESYFVRKIGLGAGKRDYNTAGILRAMLIEDSEPAGNKSLTGVSPMQTGKSDAYAGSDKEDSYIESDKENSYIESDKADTYAEPGKPDASPQSTGHDRVMVMQTNLDDCSPEAMGFTMECLLAEGALDVFYTPIYMKKNRPAYMLTVLARREDREKMENIIFRHTTSIGVRIFEAERTILEREIRSMDTPWGPAEIKCCRFGDETYCYPEYESVSRIARSQGCSYEQTWNRIRIFAETKIKD